MTLYSRIINHWNQTVNCLYLLFISIFTLVIIKPVLSHETWIEVENYNGGSGLPIIADFMIGENFKGDTLAHIPSKVVFSGLIDKYGNRELQGYAGDYPAISKTSRVGGLHILYYQTKPEVMLYKEFNKFEKFAYDYDLDWAIEAHRKRGLQLTNFTESYSRCAKALLWRDMPNGEDMPVGMPLELVLLKNPYENKIKSFPKFIMVRLLWNGEPLANRQIKVFRKDIGQSLVRVKTNFEGIASVSMEKSGVVMLNAVHIVPIEKTKKEVWHSFWASLTFEIK